MDAVQKDALATVLFCNHCGKAVKVYASERTNLKCPYCRGMMQDKNMPGWNELDIVEKENLLIDWKQQARDSKQLDERLFRRRNRNKIVRLRLMEAGIYIAVFLLAVLFIKSCKRSGIILGGIPSAIIYLIAFLLSRMLANAVK